MPLDAIHPLKVTTSKWSEKIKLAKKFKRENFDVYAEEAMAFYTGFNSSDSWSKYMAGEEGRGVVSEDGEAPSVQFKFMLARVAELVQIYGPMLYHRNPVRTVTPRTLADIPVELFDMQVPPAEQIAQQLISQMMMQMQMSGQQPNPQQMQQQALQQAQQIRQQQVQQAHQAAQMEQSNHLALGRAKAKLMEVYLNYTPNELDLKQEARDAIDEALIKGMGLLWTETYRPYPGAPTMVGSFYDTVDNLVIDPDAESIKHARWIARKCKHPVWQVADEYGIDEELLRKHANILSLDKASEQQVERDMGEPEDEESRSNDEVCYWKVYSRMGMGDRLGGIPKDQRRLLDDFGDNVYLVICEGMDYPLNLPEELLIAAGEDEEAFDEAFERIQWPIPYWIENEWPFEELIFHFIPNEPYPMSHIRPGLPELKFANWTMSFMADHARHTSRLLIGTLASLEDEESRKITDGGPIEAIKFSASEAKNLNEVMSYMTPPKGTTTDLWNINEKIEEVFEKRTGLNEAMYASPGGSRSATESQMKHEAMNIRPDDMANRVEDWMSRVARKEALAAQWLLEVEDVLPVLGPVGARMWEQLIMGADPGSMALEFDYRIEAGSARKPNKAQKIENMQMALQTVLPILMQYSQMSGDVQQVNALLVRWAKVNDIDDPEEFMLKPPDPQQAQKQQQMQDEQHQMEKQKMQLEAMKLQTEMQGKGMDAQLKQLDMVQKQMEMQFKREEAELDMAIKQQEMVQDQRMHEQELMQDQQEHAQEMEQEQQKSHLQLALEQQMGSHKIQMAEQQGKQQLQMSKQQGDMKVQQMKQQAKAKPKTKQGA